MPLPKLKPCVECGTVCGSFFGKYLCVECRQDCTANENDYWICHWSDIDRMIEILLRDMKRAKYKPDFIVGISRGGLVPAVMLSHHLNVPMLPIVWATRDFIEQDHERVEQVQKLVRDDGKTVLVVDDICDTGSTFLHFQECLMEEQTVGFAQGVEFCSLYVRYNAEFNPTFWAAEVPDESWVVFPFETHPQRKVDIPGE